MDSTTCKPSNTKNPFRTFEVHVLSSVGSVALVRSLRAASFSFHQFNASRTARVSATNAEGAKIGFANPSRRMPSLFLLTPAANPLSLEPIHELSTEILKKKSVGGSSDVAVEGRPPVCVATEAVPRLPYPPNSFGKLGFGLLALPHGIVNKYMLSGFRNLVTKRVVLFRPR
ncbi:uncharacterized protein LOC108959155 [Eucalyptus grandis]|uniref:uncharacterized protein LOC108959155 n=1 Tax=Eucalyptus grandis TaxID=71139 RepID=UPI00192E7B12|nr:uncharacterized protein LOC108959155 [Eucalyptus grandis]